MRFLKASLFISLLSLAGCSRDSIAVQATDNGDLKVDVLGHVDGCTIYRFLDAGRYVHFVRCGQNTLANEYYQNGKTTYSTQVPTTVDVP